MVTQIVAGKQRKILLCVYAANPVPNHIYKHLALRQMLYFSCSCHHRSMALRNFGIWSKAPTCVRKKGTMERVFVELWRSVFGKLDTILDREVLNAWSKPICGEEIRN